MEARYLKRKNDSGVEERFYPITHADAVIGLRDKLDDDIDSKISSAIASLGITKTLMETLPLQTATVEGQTEFVIDFEAFDASTDKVLVQSGITMLYPNVDFTVNNKTVILSEGVPLGRTIGMYVFKDVVVPYSDYDVSGSTIVDGTITKDKLSTDVQNELNALRATVDELKAHLGI